MTKPQYLQFNATFGAAATVWFYASCQCGWKEQELGRCRDEKILEQVCPVCQGFLPPRFPFIILSPRHSTEISGLLNQIP